MQTFTEQFKRARRAAVPIIAVDTADQPATVRTIVGQSGSDPVMTWDLIRGLQAANETGSAALSVILNGAQPAVTKSPGECLSRLGASTSQDSIVIFGQAHRIINNEVVSCGVGNLREVYKQIGASLVLLGPGITLPLELQADVRHISDPLPGADAIEAMVDSICADAGIETVVDKTKVVDTLIGLSEFSAEQTLATCIIPGEGGPVIDRAALWESKCRAIEQTPGLSIYRGRETFEDIGGCSQVKSYLRALLTGGAGIRAIVMIDEIEKGLAGVAGDLSGTSQDQFGALLSWMQDTEARGAMFIGPPGAAKSAVCKAAGNEVNVPTVIFDIGATKGSLVGQSGQQMRAALKTIQAISQGRTLVVATCNSIGVLPPELRRRFAQTFFYDLPTAEEQKLIWPIYARKYNLLDAVLPANTTGWTGAEIRQCAMLAHDLSISLQEAAQYVVPVAVSAADQIQALRQSASGNFLSASYPGVYRYEEARVSKAPVIAPGRKIKVDNYDA